MPQRLAGKPSFLNDLLQSIADQGRGLVARAIGPAIDDAVREQPLEELAAALLSSRGEASGVAIAREIMRRYGRLDAAGRLAFLRLLERRFAPDAAAIREAFRRFEAAPSSAALRALNAAVEPPRQELIRRLNLAPGNTLGLVRMREDLLDALRDDPRARRHGCRFPASLRLLVQPRLPRDEAHRMVDAGPYPREDHPLRGGACDRELGRPAPPAGAPGPALLRLLPSGAGRRAAHLRRGGADHGDPRRHRADPRGEA